jgi:hypothetical protein
MIQRFNVFQHVFDKGNDEDTVDNRTQKSSRVVLFFRDFQGGESH